MTTCYQIARYKKSRFWAIYDAAGRLICLTVYKKGAEEVVRLLLAAGINPTSIHE